MPFSTSKCVISGDRTPSQVNSVAFSPDGTTLASGAADGMVSIYAGADYKRLRFSLGSNNGNWLTCGSTQKCWRYEDGSFLVNKDERGEISPIFPPRPSEQEHLELLPPPSTLTTNDGAATPFSLNFRNAGESPIYWLRVVQEPVQDGPAALAFFPPPTKTVLRPGETVEMHGKVSSLAKYENPQGRVGAILSLQITTAHGDPIPLDIPVNTQTPQLELLAATQTEDKGTVQVTLKNSGKQDLLDETNFQATIAGVSLDTVSREAIKADETVNLSFAMPNSLIGTEEASLELTAVKFTHPAHVWKFPEQPITVLPPPWWLYAAFGLLFIGSSVGVYYLRLYLHPLISQLSRSPEDLQNLPLEQLPQTQQLLQRTGRLDTVLSASDIQPDWFENAVHFDQHPDAEERYRLLLERISAVGQTVPNSPMPLFKLQMNHGFMLNIDQWLIAIPPAEMSTQQVLANLQRIDDTNFQTCLIISTEAQQQAGLRKESSDPTNWFVTPNSRELTALLLAPNPSEILARLIASQIKVTRISPFQTRGGVNKESVFFGRTQLLAEITQREPANYLLIGGRQLGKSSLLKELERRYKTDPNVECHYVVLSSAEISSHLSRAFDLPPDTKFSALFEHIQHAKNGKRFLFLVDEADSFVEEEARNGYVTLHQFRSLSEAGLCHFILAGFWGLYRAATVDYQSPIKNFGETLSIGALEADACYELATQPMQLLNIRYESEELIQTLIHETGQRANLIAIACNELLQGLDMQERIIHTETLDQVLDSNAIRTALAGWEALSGVEAADRLDRIIVYATVHRDQFTLTDLLHVLDENAFQYDPEQVKQSLSRLELAFILKRERQNYTFCVPLFKKIILEQEPSRLLLDELRLAQK